MNWHLQVIPIKLTFWKIWRGIYTLFCLNTDVPGYKHTWRLQYNLSITSNISTGENELFETAFAIITKFPNKVKLDISHKWSSRYNTFWSFMDTDVVYCTNCYKIAHTIPPYHRSQWYPTCIPYLAARPVMGGNIHLATVLDQ